MSEHRCPHMWGTRGQDMFYVMPNVPAQEMVLNEVLVDLVLLKVVTDIGGFNRSTAYSL